MSRLIGDEIRYKLMRLLQANPELSQRDVARELGVSVGKANYCVKALVRQGWVKVNNFRNSDNKLAYKYLVTPRGLDAKARITIRFLRSKMDEYETLRLEIEQIRREAGERRI